MEEKSHEKEFEIKYVKSTDFKNYFSTGVIGGGTLNGLININFFVDTIKLPERVARKIKDDLISNEETKPKTALGSIRELQVGILVDINTAKKIEKWLHERIELHENEVKKIKGLNK